MIPTTRAASKTTQIAAAVIGNAFEWYDFIAFGFLTVVIARLFFPTDNQYTSLLLTTATFGVGFFMRPVGGLVLGMYADRKGRKAALQLIIGLMTVAIAMIAFAPTYATVGIAAPLIIVVARLLQGFATGGEFASATVFLIESAPPHRRGFYGSWQMVGQGLAVLIGALLGALVTRGLSPDALDSWGWRVPFLFGLVIGPIGLYIRRYLSETDAFVEARSVSGNEPRLMTTLSTHFKEKLVSIGTITFGTIAFYVILVYMPTFARTQLHLQLDEAFAAQAISLVCMIVLIPVFGLLCDRVGRKPIMVVALILYLMLAYPLFSWVSTNPGFGNLVIMQVILCGILAAFYGPLSTVLAEQFPARTRSTRLSIAYNIAVMVFGGFAQFFVTWLIEVTGSPIAPAFYVMFGAAVGLLAAFFLVDRTHEARLPTVEPALLNIEAA
jgi:MHS family proline/betaine transporter-like MFS transporter